MKRVALLLVAALVVLAGAYGVYDSRANSDSFAAGKTPIPTTQASSESSNAPPRTNAEKNAPAVGANPTTQPSNGPSIAAGATAVDSPASPRAKLTDADIDAVAIRIGAEIHREPSTLECDEGGCSVHYEIGDEDPEHLRQLVNDAITDHKGFNTFVWTRDDTIVVNMVR